MLTREMLYQNKEQRLIDCRTYHHLENRNESRVDSGRLTLDACLFDLNIWAENRD